jgi:hypothetical protein
MSLSDVALGTLLLVSSVAVSFAVVCGWLWYQEHRRQKRWAADDARMNAEIAAMRAAASAAAAPFYRELRYQRHLNARTRTVTWCRPQESARPVQHFQKRYRDIVVEALPEGAFFALPVLSMTGAVLQNWRGGDFLLCGNFCLHPLVCDTGGFWGVGAVAGLAVASCRRRLLRLDAAAHLGLTGDKPLLPSLPAAIGVGCIGLAACVVTFLIELRHREPQ